MTSTKNQTATAPPDLEQAAAHLEDLRARAAAGEHVTAETLGEAEHALTVAELHAAGVAERERQAAEAEREATITRLMAELTGDASAARIRGILTLRQDVEAAVAKLHQATAEHVGTQDGTVKALKRLLPDEARVVSAHDSLGINVRDVDAHVDLELPARLVAHAVAFGMPDHQQRRKVADKLTSTVSSMTTAEDVLIRLRRARGETAEQTGPTHAETRHAELTRQRAALTATRTRRQEAPEAEQHRARF